MATKHHVTQPLCSCCRTGTPKHGLSTGLKGFLLIRMHHPLTHVVWVWSQACQTSLGKCLSCPVQEDVILEELQNTTIWTCQPGKMLLSALPLELESVEYPLTCPGCRDGTAKLGLDLWSCLVSVALMPSDQLITTFPPSLPKVVSKDSQPELKSSINFKDHHQPHAHQLTKKNPLSLSRFLPKPGKVAILKT